MKPRVPANKYKKFIKFVEFLKRNNATELYFKHAFDYIFMLSDDLWVRAAFIWKDSGDIGYWHKISMEWEDMQNAN